MSRRAASPGRLRPGGQFRPGHVLLRDDVARRQGRAALCKDRLQAAVGAQVAAVQPAGVGGGAALALLVQQHIFGVVQFIIQLVQGAQQHADAVLVQKGQLFHVGKFHPRHIRHQVPLFQGIQQRLQRLDAAVRLGLRRLLAGRRSASGAVRRLGRDIGQLVAGGRADRVPAVEDGQGRQADPAAGGRHGVDGGGGRHPDHHRAGIDPLHRDVFQQGERLFQRRGLGGWVKAENVFFQLDPEGVQNFAAGVGAGLVQRSAGRRLHLDGVDLEQHGHGQIDAGGGHAEHQGYGGQPAQHPAAAQHLAGDFAPAAHFPALHGLGRTPPDRPCLLGTAGRRRAGPLPRRPPVRRPGLPSGELNRIVPVAAPHMVGRGRVLYVVECRPAAAAHLQRRAGRPALGRAPRLPCRGADGLPSPLSLFSGHTAPPPFYDVLTACARGRAGGT